jgi:hypothetical protein
MVPPLVDTSMVDHSPKPHHVQKKSNGVVVDVVVAVVMMMMNTNVYIEKMDDRYRRVLFDTIVIIVHRVLSS